MIFGQDRNQMRQMFVNTWRKQVEKLPMEALEMAVAAVIAEHAEYHALLGDVDTALTAEFPPEAGMSNPFLHMALHLSVREQVATNRPQGIATLHRQLCTQMGNPHDAEHRMIDVLGEHLWRSSRSGSPPDDKQYILDLKKLLSK